MRFRLPTQAIVALVIVVIGIGVLLGEYVLVKWYPRYQADVADAAQRLLPYQNQDLGIEMQVAAGIYGKVENVPGGVRIYRPKLGGNGPSLTIISQANPDGAANFSPQILAEWQAFGANHNIARYNFEKVQINTRDAALVWQLKGSAMLLTAHIISPTRIIQADCTPGVEQESTYMPACEASLRSIKVAGPPTPPPAELQPIKPAKGVVPPQRTQ
jgi:hypothetical protein